jgi:hypothetical protein
MICKKHGMEYAEAMPGHPGKTRCGKCSETNRKRLRKLMDKLCSEPTVDSMGRPLPTTKEQP